jgi:hypothetical protein
MDPEDGAMYSSEMKIDFRGLHNHRFEMLKSYIAIYAMYIHYVYIVIFFNLKVVVCILLRVLVQVQGFRCVRRKPWMVIFVMF